MREAQLAADLERLQAAVETYKQRTGGAPPPSLQALVETGLLASIPADPFDKALRDRSHDRRRPLRRADASPPRCTTAACAPARCAASPFASHDDARAATIHRHTARRRAVDAPPSRRRAEPLLELCGLSKDYRHNWTMRRLRRAARARPRRAPRRDPRPDRPQRRRQDDDLQVPARPAPPERGSRCCSRAGRSTCARAPPSASCPSSRTSTTTSRWRRRCRSTRDLYGLHGRAARAARRRGDRAGATRPKRRAPLRTLSKGTLQRVGIAQAILNHPRLLILDEPMSGLDPIGRHAMRELVRALHAAGTTIIFSSHILPDAEALCDRVAILAGGRLREIVDVGTAGAAVYQLVVAAVCPPTPWRRSSASPGGAPVAARWRLAPAASRIHRRRPGARSGARRRRHRRESRPRASVARGALPRPRRIRHPSRMTRSVTVTRGCRPTVGARLFAVRLLAARARDSETQQRNSLTANSRSAALHPEAAHSWAKPDHRSLVTPGGRRARVRPRDRSLPEQPVQRVRVRRPRRRPRQPDDHRECAGRAAAPPCTTPARSTGR